jgi:hypothetical protein
MIETKHAPTPWKTKGIRPRPIWAYVLTDENGNDIAQSSYQNATFIIRAVNAHDDLVKALARIMSDVDDGYTRISPAAGINASAALAKAEGKE